MFLQPFIDQSRVSSPCSPVSPVRKLESLLENLLDR